MANTIKKLPDGVINELSVGAVINRSASVVKELLENAVDAGASFVRVSIRGGGMELIEVEDNGCGLSPIDVSMAFTHHATSKIATLADLRSLHTFGFRGEALASIADVARVELCTRQIDNDKGTQIKIEGGEIVSQSAVGSPAGFRIVVRNLFYNDPALRRFLNKGSQSDAQVKTEFQRVALCHPSVCFELHAEGAMLCRLEQGTLIKRIIDVIGKDSRPKLLKVDAHSPIVRIEGFIGTTAMAKPRNSTQYFFVNNRFFRSADLHNTVLKAYEHHLSGTDSPSYLLYLTVDPALTDVNIHPQKTEVAFADESAVRQTVHTAVQEALAGPVPCLFEDLN